MLTNTRLYLTIIVLSFPHVVKAAPGCEQQWIAKLVSAKGRVEKLRYRHSEWVRVKNNEYFCQGDRLRTSRHSRVTLELGNESLVTLEQNSTLSFPVLNKSKFSWLLELFEGGAFFRSRRPHQLEIDTPFVNAVHEGTEFLVRVTDEQTEITVFDGRVAAENNSGRALINKQQIGITNKNQITRVKALSIHPKDAVQWALYYPPVVDFQNLENIPALRPALDAYRKGDVYLALQLLDKIPAPQHNESTFALKASLLLTVGSITEALQDIAHAQQIKATSSTALAIKAIIAVAKNQPDQALSLAQKATELSPGSAVAKIALSYALQAAFKIAKALEVTKQAVESDPGNALAWARLAELQLSTGERGDALESAKKARQLNPQLERTQTVLGFAYLAQIDIDEAKTAFNKAIDLNPADPLAWLGIGLAKIRKGHIKEGARDLETAVSLDPDNAIMRSYLGKAYYELRNEGYAATELAIAKEMDPNDPTPWFYDAILKQTTNRPVEALHDMQKAIELNDNRGVYRSRLMLDEDLAARSASLGRIYNDLGFEQLGLVEGWKSVNTDPSNYSAHRLLGDNYSSRPRHEIARVSELLQSKLLQPINITPVQPQLAESNLQILDGLGPNDLSFNEFNPLFARNRFALQSSAIFGSNDTWGDEVTQSGLWNKFSYSLGQFHYETKGFRENNHLKTDIYNIFAQLAISPKLNIQFEYRDNYTKTGDLTINFDPREFSKNLSRNTHTKTTRFGIHLKFNPSHDLIASLIYLDRQIHQQRSDQIEDSDEFFRFKIENKFDSLIDTQAYNIELQSLHQFEKGNFILGIGHYSQDETQIKNDKTITDISSIFFSENFVDPNFEILDRDAEHNNAYLYTNINLFKNLVVTVGLSFDTLESNSLGKFEKINPKVGLEWQVTPNTTLRGTYFETMKRPLAANQTIEPTQIAGFNQFYDDLNGAFTTLYGGAFDHKLSSNIYLGAEFKWRDVEIPVRNSNRKDHHEQLHRAYIYWTPYKNLALNFDYNYERINREPLTSSDLLATELITHSLPIGFSYFNSNGLFSKFTATYFDQKVEKLIKENTKGTDQFWIFDAAIGYRFPNRWGIIKLGVQNLLNEKPNFEGLFNFPTGTGNKRIPPFSLERAFYARVTLQY